MIQHSEKNIHSITELERYLSNYKIIQIQKISESQPIDAYPNLKALRTTISALTTSDLYQPFAEKKEESQDLNASSSIKKKSSTSSIAEHESLIEIYLGNTHFLSSRPGGLNSSKILDGIAFSIKSEWNKYFDLNQKISTFDLKPRHNVNAEIICLTGCNELLVALSNGHVMYSAIKDIDSIIVLNKKCCNEAYIYAINFEHGESVIGNVHWDTISSMSSYKMMNLKKKTEQDIYMAWAMCQTCEDIKNDANW